MAFYLERMHLEKESLLIKNNIELCISSIKKELVWGGYTELNIRASSLTFRHQNFCDVYIKYDITKNRYIVYDAKDNSQIICLSDDFNRQYGTFKNLYGCIIQNTFMFETNNIPKLYLTVLSDKTTEDFLKTI